MSEIRVSVTELREQAGELRLHGLLAHWAEVMGPAGPPEHARWVTQLLGWEAAERSRRSLERRVRDAHIGRFKPLADFDWKWPTQCDRLAVEELMTLEFMADASNVVLVGPNGVGKTMCACNIAYQAVLAGKTALFITAGALLGELAALDSDSALRRRLRHYAAPDLLLIDEVGYLSYSNRHADLLFELVSRRYQHKSMIVTTNRAFAEWGRGLPQRSLRGLAGGPAHAPRASGAHRRSLVSAEGGRRTRRPAKDRARRQGRGQSTPAQGGCMMQRRAGSAAPMSLPEHWSPEQALAVFECLHAVRAALWNSYGPRIQHAWQDQLITNGELPTFDPDEPF